MKYLLHRRRIAIALILRCMWRPSFIFSVQSSKTRSGKKCENFGGNHSANYRGCSVYKELLKRLKDKQTAKSVPSVFTMQEEENFIKITGMKSNEKSSVYYADTLKSCGASTNTSENLVAFETCFQSLTQNLTTFTQNMTNIMASIQNKCKNCWRHKTKCCKSSCLKNEIPKNLLLKYKWNKPTLIRNNIFLENGRHWHYAHFLNIFNK